MRKFSLGSFFWGKNDPYRLVDPVGGLWGISCGSLGTPEPRSLFSKMREKGRASIDFSKKVGTDGGTELFLKKAVAVAWSGFLFFPGFRFFFEKNRGKGIPLPGVILGTIFTVHQICSFCKFGEIMASNLRVSRGFFKSSDFSEGVWFWGPFGAKPAYGR